jgi:hypothetical protein
MLLDPDSDLGELNQCGALQHCQKVKRFFYLMLVLGEANPHSFWG